MVRLMQGADPRHAGLSMALVANASANSLPGLHSWARTYAQTTRSLREILPHLAGAIVAATDAVADPYIVLETPAADFES